MIDDEKYPFSTEFSHYVTCQLMNIPWVVILWGVLFCAIQPENGKDAFILSFPFIVLYLFLALVMYPCFWTPQTRVKRYLQSLSATSFTFGFIFTLIYFTVFFSVFKFSYYDGTDCEIERLKVTDFSGSETYAGIQVKFKDENGDSKIGYGCASNDNRLGMFRNPSPYRFISKGSFLPCDLEDTINAENVNLNFLNSEYYSNSGSRVLDIQEEYEQNDNLRNLHDTTTTQVVEAGKQCPFKLEDYEVKLALWVCTLYDDFIDNIKGKSSPFSYKKCKYSKYGDKDNIDKNSNPKNNIKFENMEDFYLVMFEEDIYFDHSGFYCLIAFLFVPFNLYTHFWWMPSYAHRFERHVQRILPGYKQFNQKETFQKPKVKLDTEGNIPEEAEELEEDNEDDVKKNKYKVKAELIKKSIIDSIQHKIEERKEESDDSNLQSQQQLQDKQQQQSQQQQSQQQDKQKQSSIKDSIKDKLKGHIDIAIYKSINCTENLQESEIEVQKIQKIKTIPKLKPT